MFNSSSAAPTSRTRSTRFLPLSLLPLWWPPRAPRLLVPLLVLATVSCACGTPVMKTTTAVCNRPEWTAPGPQKLPRLQSPDLRDAVKNHNAITTEYFALKGRHDALSECVEVNDHGN